MRPNLELIGVPGNPEVVAGPPPARLRTAQRSNEAELKAESAKFPIIETHLSRGVLIGRMTTERQKVNGFPAMPRAHDILAAIALIYGAGVLTGFNLARRVTGFMLGGRRS